MAFKVDVKVDLCIGYNLYGGHGGLIGRASASRSNGFHDQRFDYCPEHKKHL